MLDPDELAASLRKYVWEPLIDPLRAIDPAALKAQLDALFKDLLSKLKSKVKGLLDQVKRAVDAFLNQLRQALSQVLSKLKQQIESVLTGVAELLAQLDHLLVDDLFKRLLTLLGNLATSFNEQIDRVRKELDAMLNAAPVGGSRAAAVDDDARTHSAWDAVQSADREIVADAGLPHEVRSRRAVALRLAGRRADRDCGARRHPLRLRLRRGRTAAWSTGTERALPTIATTRTDG